MTLKEFFESEQLLAIHLKTKEQSIIFSKEADKLGKKWNSGDSYADYNFWIYYKGLTCYDNKGHLSDVLYYGILDEEQRCKVLNFEDVEWEDIEWKGEIKMNDFTKKDIKNGAVVELRNGQRYFKVDYTLLDLKMSGEFINIEHYNDNLISYVKELDIMKVLNPEQNKLNPKCCNRALTDINDTNIKWTWERKEKRMKKVKLKDMTVEQYKKWLDENCANRDCSKCLFYKVNCREEKSGWITNKDLYSEKFLNQEIELEE